MKITRTWWALALFAAVSAAALVGCGGGGGGAPAQPVVTNDLSVPANATTAAAVVGQSFTFPPIPALGTTGTTTLAIGGSATSQTFTLTDATGTKTGRLTYGSCIFTFSDGTVVTIATCGFTAATAGKATSGTASVETTVPFSFQLGSLGSVPIQIPIVISANGTVTIAGSGQPLGTVNIVVTTGGSS